MMPKLDPSLPPEASLATIPDTSLDDLELAHRAARGEQLARQLVAERVVQRVHRIARAICNETQEAEDATQDALISILESIGKFRGESKLESYTDKIAVRAIFRTLRSRRKLIDLHTDFEPDALAASSSYESTQDQLPQELPAYLAALPGTEKKAVWLRHSLGWTVFEIAEAEQVTERTIKYRIHNALRRLRTLIRRDQTFGAPRRSSL